MSITSENELCAFAPKGHKTSLRAKLLLLLFVVAAVLVLDQWTKIVVLEQLSPIYPKKIIDGLISQISMQVY